MQRDIHVTADGRRLLVIHGHELDTVVQNIKWLAYVGDVVNALIALVEKPEAIGEVFNIGSSEEVAIGELAARVKAMTGSASEIVLIPYDQAYEAGFEDMPRRVPDLSKIRRFIGYAPTIGLDEILRRVVEHSRITPPEVAPAKERSRK